MSEFLVYMHVNRANDKRYIGITHHEDPERRWQHGRGYFRNKHFFDAILKYGWDNFDHIIVEKGLTKDEACVLEKQLIKKYQTQEKDFGYNITNGGEFFRHSEESKRLMSENRKGKGRQKFSVEHVQKMKDNHSGGTQKKRVRCVETNVVYESINDAARQVGSSKKLISNCCRHIEHYNTAKGYHWEFVKV